MIEDLLLLGALAGIAAGLHKVDKVAEKAEALHVKHRRGRLRVVALAAVVSCHPITVKTVEGYLIHVVEVVVVGH